MFDRVAEALAREIAPIFAIVDGARDRSIPRMLRDSGLDYRSLYEGKAAEELGSFGPYLVAIPAGLEATEQWVRAGWGRSVGVFLSCEQPFDTVRRHLRRFLMVELENGRKAYFRFYDPRVLRVFLPNCTYEEWMQFFGPIRAYLAESEDAKSLLRFSRDADEPEPERLDFVS
jgi:hypothetical protein